MKNLNANYLSNVPLFHKKCGHQVYLDMSAFYHFIAIPTLRNDTLVVEVSDFIQKPTQENPTAEMFSCLSCSEKISATDLLSTCGFCFGTYSLDALFRVKDSGGMYICAGCRDEDHVEVHPKITMAIAVRKFSIS